VPATCDISGNEDEKSMKESVKEIIKDQEHRDCGEEE
jgi:hypothetical protein